ncbi:ABC transporter ATP-binding protein [bacterium]|nr:ABC transporter ATP-binding protein [bacterium]
MKVSLVSVTKRFGDLVVVDDVSLEIADAEVFFLLGPSGCGKTTLLRCLAGFTAPETGRIYIGDRDITHLPPHQRDTGMVFQSYALWPHLDVTENVAFGLELRHIGKADRDRRVAEALALVKMSDRARHRPNQLSGGQQQRVALARALVIRPTCLLLDEPLSNLDAKLRLEMRTEIRRICKEAGLTAIYVTHDQKEALSVADRLAVLDQGKVRQLGAPRDVYERPQSRFVANFIGETNFIEGRVTGIEGERITVETGHGALVSNVPPPSPVPVGTPVTVSIRPEVIRLGDAPAGAVNVLDAAVHDTVYLGEIAQHQVTLLGDGGGQAVLKVFELHPRFVAQDAQTERVQAWVAPEDVVVLEK